MVRAAGDAVVEGVAGDALGDVLGEGGVGGAGGVGAAGDGVVDGILCGALVARLLLLMVLGVCPCLLWRRLGGLLVYRLWWRWLPLVPEVVSGDTDIWVVLAMVLLMPLAWVVWVLYLVLVCVGVVGVGEDGGATGDGDGEDAVLARLLVMLVFPMVWMLVVKKVPTRTGPRCAPSACDPC